jgi:alkyl hydroperoxide reductase subunit AhpC
LSVNELNDHQTWIKDVDEVSGCHLSYPLIADSDCAISALYGMVDQGSIGTANTYTVRSLFFIDPSHTVRAVISYPASTGRNIHEIIRVLDSLQLSDQYKIATPANWTPGNEGPF